MKGKELKVVVLTTKMILLSVILSVNLLTVLCVTNEDTPQHEPKVAFWCGKVNQHIDINTGQWRTDENGISMCATTEKEILRYCKHVYPALDIRNIVEANAPETVSKWCDPNNVNCTGIKEVKVYRCLAGTFEADALLVPKGCRFEHLHKRNKCKSHDIWKRKAVEKCKEQGMNLKNYGILIPCDTGKFNGVEFVCCPVNMTKEVVTDHKHVLSLIAGREDAPQPLPMSTPRPTTFIEKLEHEIKKRAKHLTGKSIGCDKKNYHEKRKNMENRHRQEMNRVIKQWEESEKRYNILKIEDPKQAEEMIKGVMESFKTTIAKLESLAKIERHQLHAKHHQCVQIDLNDKKNKAEKAFFEALRKNPVDVNAVLTAVRNFMKVCTEDRIHNRRHFEYMRKINPEKIDELRKTFENHLATINKRVNDTMMLLYKLPKIARRFYFELPTWAPKPKVLPTERPTATDIKTEAETTPKEEYQHGEKPVVTVVPNLRGSHSHNDIENYSKHQQKKTKQSKDKDKDNDKDKDKDNENEPEDEEYFENAHQPPATFAVVIGLSCGALVIMIIIIIVMATRKSRSSNPTKTVLVDPDNEGNSDQQHLANLQQNGYENPIYKFSEY